MNSQLEITRPSLGLAVASLVLGIFAIVLGIFVVGGLFGLVGLVLAIVHLRRPGARKGMAWTGLVLSAVGLIGACTMVPVYILAVKAIKTVMEQSQQTTDEWVGVRAPDFTVTALDGTRITLSELQGKRVVLDFWATWCPPCRREIPHFIELRNQVAPEELVIVGISDEDESTLRAFVEKNGINYPIASTGDLPHPYSEIAALPTTFFIDRHGIIQQAVVGYHDLSALQRHALDHDYAGAPQPPPAQAAATNQPR